MKRLGVIAMMLVVGMFVITILIVKCTPAGADTFPISWYEQDQFAHTMQLIADGKEIMYRSNWRGVT